MPSMITAADKLRRIMELTHWTQEQLAETLDVSQSTINRWLSGADPRGASFQKLETLYREINKDAAQEDDSVWHERPNRGGQKGLAVCGVIQAGNWLDTTLVDDTYDEPARIPVLPDARIPHAKQYALEVRGDSMNLEFREGSYVICADFAEAGISLREDLIAHVERWRHGLREVTLKALKREGDTWRLEPRSTNKSHKPIILDGETEDGVEVYVRGIVIGSYRPEPF